jgi:hypothetical protein
MLALLAPLLSSVFGSAFSSIADAYKARLAAANTQDKMAADLAVEEIKAQIAANAEATKVMALENGRWWTWMPRALVQWSFALYVTKCVVFDKLLSLGSTDPLNGDISSWAGMVMAMWFGGRTIEKVAQIFKR